MNNFIREIKSADTDVHKYFLSTAIIGFNFFGVVAVIFNLYLLSLGCDTKFIGIANACAPLSFALIGVIAGILGKKYGNRPISILAVLLLIISNTLVPLSQQLPLAFRETAIILLRIMTGTGFSLASLTDSRCKENQTDGRVHIEMPKATQSAVQRQPLLLLSNVIRVKSIRTEMLQK